MYVVATIFTFVFSSSFATQGLPLQWNVDSSSSVWAAYDDETATLSVTLMTTNYTDHDCNAVLYQESEGDRCHPPTRTAGEDHATFKYKRILKLPLTECPSNAPPHQMRARFLLASGKYCLFIYAVGKLLFHSEAPMNVPSNRSESHYKYWNPALHIESYGADTISIDIYRTDRYEWNQFVVDLYRQSEYVEDCREMVHVVQRNIIDIGRKTTVIYRSLSVGWYCFSLTPYRGLCASDQNPTDFPETEFSRIIRLADNELSIIHHELSFVQSHYMLIVVVIAALVVAFDVLIVRSGKNAYPDSGTPADSRRTETLDHHHRRLNKAVSVMMLYSTENDAFISSIEDFKSELRRRFPRCQIDDCRDPEQWEAVSTQGITWLLCRIEKRDVRIVVIESEDMDRARWNVPRLKNLNQIASTAALSLVDYRRVLVVRLANVPRSTHSPQLEAWTPFTRFTLPRDWNVLDEHLLY